MLSLRVISLVGSPRRADMTAQMNALGRPWAYLDAEVGAAPVQLPYDPADARWRFGRALAEAELGCFASHWQLWRELATGRPDDAMLILEDDIVLDPDFFRQIDDVAAAMVARRYDFVRLYAIAEGPVFAEGNLGGHQVMRYAHEAWGTQAYLLTGRGARRLVDTIHRVERPIDNELDRWWRHGMMNRVIHPFPVSTGEVPSLIESPRAHAAAAMAAPRWRAFFLQQRNRALTALLSGYTMADIACRRTANWATADRS